MIDRDERFENQRIEYFEQFDRADVASRYGLRHFHAEVSNEHG